MKRTQEAFGNLVNYDSITAIRPLEPPKIEKKAIPKFILCQNYDKAMEKAKRTMERYNSKVRDLRSRVDEIDSEIQYINKQFSEVERLYPAVKLGTPPEAVAK